MTTPRKSKSSYLGQRHPLAPDGCCGLVGESDGTEFMCIRGPHQGPCEAPMPVNIEAEVAKVLPCEFPQTETLAMYGGLFSYCGQPGVSLCDNCKRRPLVVALIQRIVEERA